MTTDRILRACQSAGHRAPDAAALCALICANEFSGCTAEALADFLEHTRPDADDWHYYLGQSARVLARRETRAYLASTTHARPSWPPTTVGHANKGAVMHRRCLVSRQEIYSATRAHTPWTHYQHRATDFAAYILGYLGIDAYFTAPDLDGLTLPADPSADDIAESLCVLTGAYNSAQLSLAALLYA